MLCPPNPDGTLSDAIHHLRSELEFPSSDFYEFAVCLGRLNQEWKNAVPQLLLELWLTLECAAAPIIVQQALRLIKGAIRGFEVNNRWSQPPVFDLTESETKWAAEELQAGSGESCEITLQSAINCSGIPERSRHNPRWVLYCRVLSAFAARAAAGQPLRTVSAIRTAVSHRLHAVISIEERWLQYLGTSSRMLDDKWQETFVKVHANLLKHAVGPIRRFGNPPDLQRFHAYFTSSYEHNCIDRSRREDRERTALGAHYEQSRLVSSPPDSSVIESYLDTMDRNLFGESAGILPHCNSSEPAFHVPVTIAILARFYRVHHHVGQQCAIDLILNELSRQEADQHGFPIITETLLEYSDCMQSLFTWSDREPWSSWQPSRTAAALVTAFHSLPKVSTEVFRRNHRTLLELAETLMETRLGQSLLMLRLQKYSYEEIHALLKDPSGPPCDFAEIWLQLCRQFPQLNLPADFQAVRKLASLVGGKRNNLRDWFTRRLGNLEKSSDD